MEILHVHMEGQSLIYKLRQGFSHAFKAGRFPVGEVETFLTDGREYAHVTR